jgi:hypothetical protein
MEAEKTILEYISEVDELLEVSKFMQNDRVDEALSIVMKVITQPDIPQGIVAPTIVKLQGISSMCAIQASYYKNLNPGKVGTEEYKLKNLYFSLHEALNELTNALKYLCK